MAANRVTAILDIVDTLPANSRLNAAILSDPTEAAALAARPEVIAQIQDPDPWEPRLEDWTLTHELLAAIYDLVLSVNTGEGKRPDQYPRPPSLVTKLAREHIDAARDDWLDALRGGRVTVN